MANAQTILIDQLSGEILSSERLSAFMGFTGGLGGGSMFIPDDPTVVWEQLKWNHAFAQYVYDDIEEKDEEVGSDLEVRKEAVLSKDRVMMPASDKRQDKKVADFIEETLEGYMGGGDGTRFGFSNFLWEMLDAIGHGVVIGEVIFANANDRVYIKEVKFKPQMLFNFSEGPLAQFQNFALPQTGPVRLRTDLGFAFEGIDPNEPLPQGKFFVHTFQPKQGNRWGSPLIRRCYWLSWFKKAGLKQWVRYLERGNGTVVASYDQSEKEQELAIQLARAVSEESAVAKSKRAELEVLQNVRTSLGSAHKDLTDEYCNRGIARRILGQTGTRGGEGGWSKGNVQERVADRKTEADSLSSMLAVNTLSQILTLVNFGPNTKPPTWMLKYQPVGDLKQSSDNFYRGWQMGVGISKKFYYTTMQWPEPAEGEEVLPPPSKSDETSAIPGGDDAAFAEAQEYLRRTGRKDAAQLIVEAALRDEKKKSRQRFAAMRPKLLT